MNGACTRESTLLAARTGLESDVAKVVVAFSDYGYTVPESGSRFKGV